HSVGWGDPIFHAYASFPNRRYRKRRPHLDLFCLLPYQLERLWMLFSHVVIQVRNLRHCASYPARGRRRLIIPMYRYKIELRKSPQRQRNLNAHPTPKLNIEARKPARSVLTELVPRQPTLEGRVHHFDLRVAQNWLPTNKEVKCAKEYAFERSRARRVTACCASSGARRGRS